MTALLEVDHVVKSFGGVRAVNDVSFHLNGSTVLGLIGPNGSGKTTLLSLIAGTLAASQGRVVLDGAQLSGGHPHRTVRAGVTRTFQTSRLFTTWTLRDSMALAAHEGRAAHGEDRIGDVAGMLQLSSVLDRRCRDLTSAQQRLAMIAVALSSAPKVLLLDEPAVGMDTDEALALADAVRRVRTDLGTAVIVVDHNMHFLMPLADQVIVMASGKVLATGTPAQIRANEDVIASYLGS